MNYLGILGKAKKAEPSLGTMSNDDLVAKKKAICSKISAWKGAGDDSAIDDLWQQGLAVHNQLKKNVGDSTKGP